MKENIEDNNDTICPNCKDLWDFTDETGSSICGNCNFNSKEKLNK